MVWGSCLVSIRKKLRVCTKEVEQIAVSSLPHRVLGSTPKVLPRTRVHQYKPSALISPYIPEKASLKGAQRPQTWGYNPKGLTQILRLSDMDQSEAF